MTEEQAAYGAALNLIGTGALDPCEDAELEDTLGCLRRAAAHSAGPQADCPSCHWTVPCDGREDGEHFADLWDHLITRHGTDPRWADEPARKAWARAVAEHEGATAA